MPGIALQRMFVLDDRQSNIGLFVGCTVLAESQAGLVLMLVRVGLKIPVKLFKCANKRFLGCIIATLARRSLYIAIGGVT